MLPCVCSVIDHRWRQNVVRTKKWHTRRSRVCHWCSYHILTSSVIYYWTDAWQHGIYLFYIITKQTTTDEAFFNFKLFQHNANAGLWSLRRTWKKPFDVIYYLYKMKQSHWLLYVAKDFDWSRKTSPLSNLTRESHVAEWKLTAKAVARNKVSS